MEPIIGGAQQSPKRTVITLPVTEYRYIVEIVQAGNAQDSAQKARPRAKMALKCGGSSGFHLNSPGAPSALHIKRLGVWSASHRSR